jgi:adenylate kinase
VFDAQTKPLLDFYARRALLVDIDGEQPVEKVFADITAAIDRLGAGQN